MKIKETYENKTYTLTDNTVEILADDGRALFSMVLSKDGSLEVRTPLVCIHNGVLLDTTVSIVPRHSNNVTLKRLPYKDDI